MSAIGIDTGLDVAAAARGGPDEISRRLESLPVSSYLWRLVILLSLGGCFEIYDLFFTGYIAPGLNRSCLLTTTTQAFFRFSGIGAFVAATFAVLFIAVPVVAFLSWWLVPLQPYGVDGWRWVVLIGAAGSMVIWILRLFVPESPLWLARNGRTEQAVKILQT